MSTTPPHYLVDEHFPKKAPAVGSPTAPANIEECKEAFLDFYCKTPQARGLLSRYWSWSGYGFSTKEAQHDWAIWSAAWGAALQTKKALDTNEQCDRAG